MGARATPGVGAGPLVAALLLAATVALAGAAQGEEDQEGGLARCAGPCKLLAPRVAVTSVVHPTTLLGSPSSALPSPADMPETTPSRQGRGLQVRSMPCAWCWPALQEAVGIPCSLGSRVLCCRHCL